MRSTSAMIVGACLLAGCSPSEVHLLPAGTKGDVFILPGYRQGVPARREGFAIVFSIPPERILVTQDLPSAGWHMTHYYYVDAAGKRQSLDIEPSSVHDTPENRADQRPIVYGERNGEISADALPCPIRFVRYYVGTRAELLSRTVPEWNADELRLEQFVKEHHICP